MDTQKQHPHDLILHHGLHKMKYDKYSTEFVMC